MDIKKLGPKEIDDRLKGDNNIFLVDVRSEDKYNEYHLKNATNIPKTKIFEMNTLENNVEPLIPKDKDIVVVCTTGNSATKCAKILAEQNYNVTVLDGGITAWKEYINSH